MADPIETSVPDKRPRERINTLHGPVDIFKPLSVEQKELGARLLKVRRSLHLFLFTAARACGLGTAAYSECERGVRAFNVVQALDRLVSIHAEQGPDYP